MCLCNSAASSAFPFLRVFNQPGASGKRAELKNPCLVMERALGELGYMCLCRQEQICWDAHLGPVLERSQGHRLPLRVWQAKRMLRLGPFLFPEVWDAEHAPPNLPGKSRCASPATSSPAALEQ